MSGSLPPDVVNGASLRGNEYGWRVSDFLGALSAAKSHGLACLGGQFQFRLPVGTYEMYWLNADSTDRHNGETWADYSGRSCSEVLDKFNDLVSKTDFAKEASNWGLLSSAVESLVFVAYFETKASLAEVSDARRK
jgi:hypothetical protein